MFVKDVTDTSDSESPSSPEAKDSTLPPSQFHSDMEGRERR